MIFDEIIDAINIKPYYLDREYGQAIYCADSREVLSLIPHKSIGLVLTDPPYELDWRQSIDFKGRKNMYHHQEDTQLWDKDVRKLYQWLFPICDSLVVEVGSILIFTRSEYITWAVEEAKSNHFDNKATMVWHKPNPMPQVRKKNYLSSIEHILWVTRYSEDGVKYTFNFLTQNEMHNYFEIPLCGGDERTEHPTQKPEELIKKLLTIHSNIDDIVLDPFLGSGTTAYCSKVLGRKCIGIETEEKYCDFAVKRLRQSVMRFNL